jgi:hypothetical protein
LSSGGRKRTLKDELEEKPEKKKLTHRIHEKRKKGWSLNIKASILINVSFSLLYLGPLLF